MEVKLLPLRRDDARLLNLETVEFSRSPSGSSRLPHEHRPEPLVELAAAPRGGWALFLLREFPQLPLLLHGRLAIDVARCGRVDPRATLPRWRAPSGSQDGRV